MTDHLQDLFDRAVCLPPEQRGAFLQAECDDPALRAGVERLLAHDDRIDPDTDGERFRSPIIRDEPAPLEGRPAYVGRYRVVRLLGEGGMGTVYEAVQEQPHRTVALKLIRPGLLSTSLVRRFAQEADILGRLNHPGIAQVYEAGVSADGQPFFAMEMVRGVPLDEYARGAGLATRGVLELLATVCDAVHHAHERGVIHRDLKPGNILVDESGAAKVLDFGIARVADSELRTDLTQAGQVLGTLNYISPEQLGANPEAIDRRADVYALGVILFELLARRHPHSLSGLPLAEAARVIRQDEPARLGAIDRRLRGEIETIVGRALEKDGQRRYPSADELASDLRRFLANEPIRARPPSALYRARKFVRRHAGLVVGVTATLVMLVAGVIGTGIFALREAERARFAEQLRQKGRRDVYAANLHLAARAWDEGQLGVMETLLREAAAGEPGDIDLRGIEWSILWRLGHPPARVYREHSREVRRVAFSPDGRHLASCDIVGYVQVREVESGTAVWSARSHDKLAMVVNYSPDGNRLVSGGGDGTVMVWDARTGTRLVTLKGFTGAVHGVSFSPDGRRLAAGGDGEVMVFDADTGEVLATARIPRLYTMSLRYTPDGSRLVLASAHTLRVLDANTCDQVYATQVDKHWLPEVAISPDGQRLVTAQGEGTATIRDANTGKEQVRFRGHSGWVTGVCFSPDGKLVASSSRDGSTRVWEADTGREAAAHKGHNDWVMGVAFSPDGRLLATAGADGTVRVVEVNSGGCKTVALGEAVAKGVTFRPGSQEFATIGSTGRIKVWQDDAERLALKGFAETMPALSYSPDGSLLASGGRGHTLRVWDANSGQERLSISCPSLVSGVAFRPDGRRLGAAEWGGHVRVYDLPSGKALLDFRAEPHSLWSIAYSPDGRRLATTGARGMTRVWDAQTGHQVHALSTPLQTVCSVQFSPDGKHLATAGKDQIVRIWDAASGHEVFALRGHSNIVRSVAYSPDGTRLASAGDDRTVRLWDTVRGKEMLTLRLPGWIYWVTFSDDGRLAAAVGDGIVRVWDTNRPDAEGRDEQGIAR